MRAKRSWVAVAVGVVGLAIPAPASAANSDCSNDVTKLATIAPGPSNPYAVPSDGVVTSWSFLAGSSVTDMKFKVARSAGGNSFTVVGDDVSRTPLANQLNTFFLRMPVRAGDVIGFWSNVGPSNCFRSVSGSGWGVHFRFDDQLLGSTAAYNTQFPLQLNLSATLEPDCDNDGFGDETQDPELPLSEACGKGGQFLTLDASKNKVRKGKRVTLFGGLSLVTRQGECEAGQTVQLQRKRPSQAIFNTFRQLQTDPAGGFSAKVKVKKTFEYRAQAVETDACLGQISNTEKVKVKKKK
jgi:hypothetical protein